MKRNAIILLLALFYSSLHAQGYYIEFKITSTSSQESGVAGTMRSYYQDGNTRMEMNMKVPGLSDGNMSFIGLILDKTPNTFYLLNEKSKTYSELETNNDEDYKDYPQNEYEITVIGKDKVNGYNSTHITVKVKGKQVEQEMWMSNEVNDYASFSKLKTKYTGKANLLKAMEAKGVAGFPVRIIANEHNTTLQIDLVKADKRNNSSTLFSLNGYAKSDGFSGIEGGEDIQEMMKKLQNLTPEERNAMIERIQQLYGKQPH